MIPFRTPIVLPYFYPKLLWRVPTTEKSLYLTFDDGPVPGPTEQVLEILKERKCQATFFCIGDNIRKHPDIFTQVVRSHHLVGNHTYNHLNGWRTETELYLDNIHRCEDLLHPDTGSPGLSSKFFRPPYGRITFKQINRLKAYRIVMWDVLTHDYNQRMSGDYCLRQSIKATRNGSIIVFHDSIKAEKNMSFVLPRYIDHFLGQGYTFKILS